MNYICQVIKIDIIMTFLQLIEAAKFKGLHFDTYSTFRDRFDSDNSGTTVLTIKTGEYFYSTWTFYRSLSLSTSEWYFKDDIGIYEGRYYQDTGKTIKSIKRQYKDYDFLKSNDKVKFLKR